MPLILHLSDLHLGRAPLDEIAGDYKDEFVPVSDRANRHKILGWTLEKLQDVESERPLAAVVVSGDITVADHEDGFQALEGLLARLGDLRPSPDRVLVVPGNHDVTWFTPPGSDDRYAKFLTYVRKAGYVTPLLDGVDIDDDGKPKIGPDGNPLTPDTAHHIVNEEAGWALIPINHPASPPARPACASRSRVQDGGFHGPGPVNHPESGSLSMRANV